MPDRKSRSARGGPDRFWSPHTTASGVTLTPELRRPDGGSANGVFFSTMADRKASSNPSTMTGIDTPRLAKTIVPTSGFELCQYGDRRPGDADADREDHREDGQLDG